MLSWDHKYDVGIERIDAQHHIFFNLVGEFQESRLAGASIEKLDSILNEIVLYAKYHFYSELNVMKEHHYPGIDEHQSLHFKLISDLSNEITGLHLKLNQARDVENFLVEWFSGHTTNEDSKFAKFILGDTKPPN
jgi:hemerythrin